ncbi:MAG: GNAT family N-acetyltransferase [Firmicutes bacterium]|nr:GNAT family N-acetyltransferase [Bacillota bacterium]
MLTEYKNYHISDSQESLQVDQVINLLRSTYWAKDRPESIIKQSIANSLCFGVFDKESDTQIGFARCVTDYCTAYWLCDVVIHEKWRGLGLGKSLLNYIVSHEKLQGLMGILSSRDSQNLYKQFGFKSTTSFMRLKFNKEKLTR